MFRPFVSSLLLTTLLGVSAPVTHSSDPSSTYSASEVAGSTREATSISGDLWTLDLSYQTTGTVDPDTLAWCENVLARTFAALPEDHANTLQWLTLSFDPEARRGMAGGHTMIIRCVDVDEEELTAVAVHEMGHIVDTGHLNGSASDEKTSFDDRGKAVYDSDPSVLHYGVSWTDNSSFTSDTTGFVSGYAMTNPYEDFAETYAAYVLHGDLFRFYTHFDTDLKKKYEFMRDTVFEGVEFDFGSEDLPKISEVEERVYDITRVDYTLESFWSLSGGQ